MIRFRISQRYYPIVVAIQFLTHVLDKFSEKKPKKKTTKTPIFTNFWFLTKKKRENTIYIYIYISKNNIQNKFKKIIGASVDKKN